MKIETQLITSKETFPLRHRVLRPSYLNASDCALPEDDLPSTFHLGWLMDGELASVATFMEERHPDLAGRSIYRLRGMATAPEARGRGGGAALIRHGEILLRKRACDLLWCKARVVAFGFYEKLGFSFYGDLFEIEGIGPHKVMYKHLNPR